MDKVGYFSWWMGSICYCGQNIVSVCIGVYLTGGMLLSISSRLHLSLPQVSLPVTDFRRLRSIVQDAAEATTASPTSDRLLTENAENASDSANCSHVGSSALFRPATKNLTMVCSYIIQAFGGDKIREHISGGLVLGFQETDFSILQLNMSTRQ